MFHFSLIAMLYRGAFKVSVQDSLHYKSHLQANSSNNLLLLYYYLPNWHISHKILKNIGGNSGFNAGVYGQMSGKKRPRAGSCLNWSVFQACAREFCRRVLCTNTQPGFGRKLGKLGGRRPKLAQAMIVLGCCGCYAMKMLLLWPWASE